MEQNRVPQCQLPAEILRIVMESIEWFGYVEEEPIRARSTLRSALLVNTAWAAEAIRILWKSIPVTALAAINDHDRRQLYARYVRKLEVHEREYQDWMAEYSTLHDVELPLLKFIDIDDSSYLVGDVRLCVENCMRPSLEEVRFTDYNLDSEMIHLVRKRCPKLKKINAFEGSACYGRAGIKALIELIDSCKSLRSVSLDSHGLYPKNFEEDESYDIESGAGCKHMKHPGGWVHLESP